jgi:hypothetical protein
VPVALKSIFAAHLTDAKHEAVHREAALHKSLCHAAVVTLFGLVEYPSHSALVLELQYQSLSAYLHSAATIGWPERARLGREVASGCRTCLTTASCTATSRAPKSSSLSIGTPS